jgi:hypothetical protein
MKKQYWILGLAISILAAGCGGANKDALYTRGPMPFDGNFDGVYQSDFGRLELTVESGDRVVGLYERNDVYGRIEGEVNGNLLLFKWTQWNVEMRGKIRETSGRGVFQYMVDEAQGNSSPRHWMSGYWAYGKDSPTNPWKAYKLGTKAKKKLVAFDPASYTGSEEEEEVDNSGGFQPGGGGDSSGGGDSGGGGGDSGGGDMGGGDAEIF